MCLYTRRRWQGPDETKQGRTDGRQILFFLLLLRLVKYKHKRSARYDLQLPRATSFPFFSCCAIISQLNKFPFSFFALFHALSYCSAAKNTSSACHSNSSSFFFFFFSFFFSLIDVCTWNWGRKEERNGWPDQVLLLLLRGVTSLFKNLVAPRRLHSIYYSVPVFFFSLLLRNTHGARTQINKGIKK